MILILILAVIGVQRYLNMSSVAYQLPWFSVYHQWMRSKITQAAQPNWQGLLILALPLLLIAMMLFGFVSRLFGNVGYYALGLLMLWYCIDARDFSAYPDTPSPTDLLVSAYRSLFGYLFWFALCGPLGLILYYIVSILYQKMGDRAEVRMLLSILDWIPMRLLAFSFALVGHFSSVFSVWVKQFSKGLSHGDAIIVSCGQLVTKSREDAVNLLNRVLIVWLVVIGLVTLGVLFG